jgi:hypothetical protein
MSEDEGSIERLRKGLYSRDSEGKVGIKGRQGLRQEDFGVPETWRPESRKRGPIDINPHLMKKKRTFFTPLLIIAFIFFVSSVGVSLYLFFGQSVFISPNKVDIRIQGPTTIGGGDEVALQIAVTNRNSIAIELSDLVVVYPDGTRSANDISLALPRMRQTLGTIEPGQTVQQTVRAVLFGEEQSEKEIKVSVEYRTEGSNAIFFAENLYTLTLSTSPLGLTVEALDEITSGQEMSFKLRVSSNSTKVVNNAMLAVEYPFGFSYTSASPSPTTSENIWRLGDIEPEGERVINVRGSILGEDSDERVFRFSLGVQSENDSGRLGVVFSELSHSVLLQKPFISVDLLLDGSGASEYIARSGREIRGDVTWFNNLPDDVDDAEIQILIRGAALDRRTVSAQRGFYNSSADTIVWSSETEPDLASLAPGESGNVSFSFAPLGLASGAGLRSPEISLRVNVKGRRVSSSNVPETIESFIEKKVKVSSDLLLTSRALYFSGPFANTGALPPKAEEETTYTIVWSIANTSNSVSEVKVKATLPSYMRWMALSSPSSESISYNSVGGEVTWDVGRIEAGGTSIAREVAFQVALLPSLTQIGSSPIIVNEQTLSGKDRFTGSTLRNAKEELTTRLTTDTGFDTGAHSRVVE